jgi:hypothetical protein
MYDTLFGQFKKQLRQMLVWFDRLEEHAKARSFSPDVLVVARLAPDQLAFARQVQIACDTAKLASSRLTGKPAPSHADSEQTIEELRGRVKSTLEYLETFSPADFAEAATRVVSQPRWEGKTMTGADYFLEHVMPNFFFHVTHVYALLRHNGVDLGKKDYLGALSLRAPA